MESVNMKEVNEHLIGVGQKLELVNRETAETFCFHTLEDGRQYYKPRLNGEWQELTNALPCTIQVNTLTALKDYLGDNPDGLDLKQMMVHVCDPVTVRIISTPMGGYQQRDTRMWATALIPQHRFGDHVDPEIFVPYLQSCFCDSEDLSALIKISGNIVDTSEVRLQDDGVSQEVTVRAGAARKAEVAVPSPAVLFPFSTFAEVNQPPRKFIFRLSSQPLRCALLEADGGAWKLNAIEAISKWLRENLPEQVKIIA